jgi:WD40 repeat protein
MVVKLALLRGLSRCVWVHVFAYLTVFLRVLLFAGSDDKTVRLWEVATQRELAVLTGHTDRVTSVAFDGSGKYLASGGARGATSSSIDVFDMLLKRYLLRCIVRAQLQLRIVLLLFTSISCCSDSITCCFCVIFAFCLMFFHFHAHDALLVSLFSLLLLLLRFRRCRLIAFYADCDAYNDFDIHPNIIDNHDQLMNMTVILS